MLTEIARGWLGTQWQHHQSVKGVACDCVGFLLGVAKEANLDLPEIPRPYARLPKKNEIQKYLDANFTRTDTLSKDKILLLEFSGLLCHVAIATSKESIIHADSKQKKVIEHKIDQYWYNRIINIYEVKK